MRDYYDIAIIGGGMVGASMAVALSDTSMRVLLLDSSVCSPAPLPEDYDIRVSAISVASKYYFQSLGIWSGLQDFRVSPYQQMHIWEKQSGSAIHFDGAQIGEDVLGYIIENRAIQYYLLEKARRSGNIDFFDSLSIESCAVRDDRVKLTLTDDSRITCGLLVGADGNRSKVRSLAGIDTKGWKYDQSALVATVGTELPHDDTAWQCFLPDGPLAFLPLADNMCSIVWSAKHHQAQELAGLPEDIFERQLAEAFDFRLGSIKLCSERGVFPLQLQYARQYVKPGVALIGDAAHSIHPLAGQGVNLGLLDSASLVDVILEGARQGKPIGSVALLRRYERWRKGDNLGVMFLMDVFKRMFTTELGPLKSARNAGIELVNSINPIKDMIMKGASGLRGELPTMIRDGKLAE